MRWTHQSLAAGFFLLLILGLNPAHAQAPVQPIQGIFFKFTLWKEKAYVIAKMDAETIGTAYVIQCRYDDEKYGFHVNFTRFSTKTTDSFTLSTNHYIENKLLLQLLLDLQAPIHPERIRAVSLPVYLPFRYKFDLMIFIEEKGLKTIYDYHLVTYGANTKFFTCKQS